MGSEKDYVTFGGVVLKIVWLLLPMTFLAVISYFIVFDSFEVFKRISFKGVIAIYVIATILWVIFSINTIWNGVYAFMGIICLVITVISAGGMIFGMIAPQKITIQLRTAEDVQAISNLQDANKYRFIFKDDIDFGGMELKIGGSFSGEIKGNGKTLSNFIVKDGLFDNFSGKLSNVTFDNVSVKYQDRYDSEARNRDVLETMMGRNGTGVFENVTTNDCTFEFIKSTYSDGCACGDDSGFSIMFIFFGAIAILAFIGKITGKIED